MGSNCSNCQKTEEFKAGNVVQAPETSGPSPEEQAEQEAAERNDREAEQARLAARAEKEAKEAAEHRQRVEREAAEAHRRAKEEIEKQLKPRTFTITVPKKPDEKPGIDLDDCDGKTLVVNQVCAGPFESYNLRHADELQLKVNDHIISISGTHLTPNIDFNELLINPKEELTVVVIRQMLFEVQINKLEQPACEPGEAPMPTARVAEKKLGMNLNYKNTSVSLFIKEVYDGAVQDWNNEHPIRGSRLTTASFQ